MSLKEVLDAVEALDFSKVRYVNINDSIEYDGTKFFLTKLHED